MSASFLLLLISISECQGQSNWINPETFQHEINVGNIRKLHHVNQNQIFPPWPENVEIAMLGMGCFWGAERLFWKQPGVYSTHVGYAGGSVENPTYEEIKSGNGGGHVEVVRIVYDPEVVSYFHILKLFFENHNPTEGNRQGIDIGEQYRSVIFPQSDEHLHTAQHVRDLYQEQLSKVDDRKFDIITTEIVKDALFYYAEDYHQQYLSKNPDGFCGLKNSGITCPIETLNDCPFHTP